MKIKEIEQTAHIAWSPAAVSPVYLATGTAAQQLDASFSTTSQLDLYSLDLGEPGLGMGLKASIPTKQRFHKLVWGSHGIAAGDKPSGVIVGGADQGHMMMFDANKLLNGKNDETGDYLISDSKKHTGPVKALDFNPFQLNLLASGSTNSEIFIWDLNKNAAPMTPGSLSQPPEEVTCLAWNQQVQHILASTFSSRCVVWDLRKNEQIIKVSDNTSRMRCKAVAWHPDVATQLCLASEDDQFPVIQLWDLRYATSPVKTFEGHQRGILSMAWCSQDPDMLLSCGRDNKILIWNPNTQSPNGEILCEMTTSSQWSFDAGWCPRNPSVVASASFDGRIGVRSIMGGRELSLQSTNSMIADSFPGMEPAPDVHHQQQTILVHQPVKKPPKWLQPRSGASFGFGGKLVTFGASDRQIQISQVITEEELALRSKELESALQSGNLGEFCSLKSQSSDGQEHVDTWNFLGANFSPSPRQQMLQLLGYELPDPSAAGLTKSMEELDLLNPGQTDAFDTIAAEVAGFTIPTDESVDGRISKALISGDLSSAVDLCFADQRYADAMVLAMAGPPELLESTKSRYFRLTQGQGVPRLIQAVVTGNWQQVVQHCDLSNWKEALASTLTYASDEDYAALCQTIGQRLEAQGGEATTSQAVLCYICAGSMEKLVDCWSRRQDLASTTSALQELVEQVMVLQQAQQLLGRRAWAGVGSGNLTQQLCRYAGLLAGQGSLETALTYLNISQDESMVELKERLQHALGAAKNPVAMKPAAAVNGLSYGGVQDRRYSQSSVTRSLTPKPFYSQEPYNPGQSVPSYQQQPPNFYPQQQQPQPSPFAPPPTAAFLPSSQPYQPQPQPPPPSQTYQPQPPPMQSYQPAPPQGPPLAAPPTTGNASRAGIGILSKRVYVKDPSVYGSNHNPMMMNQQSGYNNYNAAPAAYNPSQPGGMYQPAPPSGIPSAQYDGSNHHQPQQQYDPYAAQQSYRNPSPTPNFMANGFTAAPVESAIFNPMDQHVHDNSAAGGFVSQTPPPSANILASVPVSSPPPGWNDPPSFSISTPTTKVEPAVEPITQPIFGSEPQQQAAFPGSVMDQERIFNPAMSYHQQMAEQQQMQQQIVEPPPVALAPIPAEHLIIHDVFTVLKDKCCALANNPQMKRKLDDVTRKLESLDERLRNNGLSGNTLQGLHQIVQAAQSLDYATAMALHTQLVSTTNFTEIGSFINGLKVLLQMCAQLEVHLQ